ncbi:XdhC family protein [Marinobacterium jannaschii]|uniref:XdhC family protein n=1 Tax=Marinobacterium jannaschii TaxID=64970 RepID=UPI0004869881|nr:XdhC/CoxI family protein [Marinobacterium jannaschii]
MSNHLIALLSQWYPERDRTDWVLGTVYKTEGPCYRKAGAMMLFSGLGQQLGMLSGGCLESDIQTHARRIMQQGHNQLLCYDGSDEDDLSFQLGIGCGGTVYIQLQPVNAANHYLQLDRLLQLLQQRRHALYYQPIGEEHAPVHLEILDQPAESAARLQQLEQQPTLITPITPPPHITIIGGGLDARPVATIAKQLGWQISLWDPRPANGRREFFMQVDHLFGADISELIDHLHRQPAQAAILMSHNIQLDAGALQALHQLPLRYIALLGPNNRKQRVLQEAGLACSDFYFPLAGPAGLSIGGELPESIALSIISECHAALFGRHGGSFSDALQAGADR